MPGKHHPIIAGLTEEYRRRLEADSLELPRVIHVETRTRCNARCAFCPANVNDDPRDDISMPEELVDRILSELSEWQYAKRLSFYNNNEPFLEPRLVSFLAKARAALPLCYLELKSNGLSVTLTKLVDAFNAGLDCLLINDYSSDGTPTPHVARLMQQLRGLDRFRGHVSEGGQDRRRILIYLRDREAVLRTRAGTSPNRPSLAQPLPLACLRPVEMMTISAHGDVSTCSEDFLFTLKMGRLGDGTLRDIWYSEAFIELRRLLLAGDRSQRPACAQCDYAGWVHDTLAEHGVLDEYNESVRPWHSKLLKRLRLWYRSESAAPRR